jgi:hypothetical protein
MYHCNTLQWLDANQSGLRARHSTKHQYMKCTVPVILSFNNNPSTVAIFSDIEKPMKLQGTVSSKAATIGPEVTSRSRDVNKDGGGVNDLLTLPLINM